MKKVITVLLAIFVICAFSACSTGQNNEEVVITSESSPDSKYTVYLYQVGSPQWSFGSVRAKLVLKNSNEKILDEVNFSLGNDGAGVYAQNLVTITWMENEVGILMDADEEPEEYYVLNY